MYNGDVTALSIYANKLKQDGGNVLHGSIRELSLVLAGANPGAFIDSVIRHANTEIVFSPLPKYPSTSRDIALLVEEDMEVGKIEAIVVPTEVTEVTEVVNSAAMTLITKTELTTLFNSLFVLLGTEQLDVNNVDIENLKINKADVSGTAILLTLKNCSI